MASKVNGHKRSAATAPLLDLDTDPLTPEQQWQVEMSDPKPRSEPLSEEEEARRKAWMAGIIPVPADDILGVRTVVPDGIILPPLEPGFEEAFIAQLHRMGGGTPKRDENRLLDRRWMFWCKSSDKLAEIEDDSVALTVTSPPYWNSIDYDLHANGNGDEWYRERQYTAYGSSYDDYLDRIEATFNEVRRTTTPGGFCAIVVGTILQNGDHFPAPMDITARLTASGWLFHQDIVWNKVTGGVKRAGSYIQRPRAGYFYPNIMTEYILIFRKPGKRRYDSEPALPVDEVFKHDIANTIWHIAPVPPNAIEHPCPFPEELVRRLVRLYSHEGDLVLDPFLGSGQTAKVAVQQGRLAIGYEIEPAYIKTAVLRIYGQNRRRYQLIPRYERLPVDYAV